MSDVQVIGHAAQPKTLRDEYAMAAMMGMLANQETLGWQLSPLQLAHQSFMFADAMLSQRNVGQTITFPEQKEVA
jgi:hypothetical protein